MKEAEDYLKQANKMLTKTITRWNPNFFSAAPLFEKVCRMSNKTTDTDTGARSSSATTPHLLVLYKQHENELKFRALPVYRGTRKYAFQGRTQPATEFRNGMATTKTTSKRITCAAGMG